MPRSFDVTVQSPVSVEQVCGAFGSEQYWLARFAAFETVTTLDSLTVDGAGTVNVATTQDLRNDGLPRLVAKFYPGNLLVRSAETWTPVGERRVEGQIAVDVEGAPGSGRGSALLQSRGDGSQLSVNGTVHFKVPLVGGKIESYLGEQFAEHISEIQHFTTTWIAEHD